MKFNEAQILCIIFLFYLISNQEIPIINFSENSYGDRSNLYIYEPEPILSPEYEGEAFFFFSFSESFFTYFYIYEGDSTDYFYKEIDDKNEFFQYKIKNLTCQKFTFKINSRRSGKLFFIDNSRESYTNLNTFLKLDFEIRDYNNKLYKPLVLNVNPSENLILILEKNYYGENYANGYLLEYCKLNGNQCKYNGITKTATFEKGEKYKIRYNCYSSSSYYEFTSFSSFNIFELEIDNIQLFQLSSNKDQYFITNVKDYENIYIYFNTGHSTDFYTKFISESERKTIDTNIKEYRYDSENTFWKNIFLFERKNDYLIIKAEYDNYDCYEGTVGVFSKIYDIWPNDIIEIDKGTKTLIQYSEVDSSYFLVSSYENMKSLKDEYPINVNFTDFLEIYSYQKKAIIYVNSTNEKTKIKLFKTQFPYGILKFNFYYNDYIKPYLESYGPDSLFMRIISQSSDINLKVFFIYGLKEEYYLYKKRYYGNIDFYQYNKELDAFTNITKFETPYYKNLHEYNLINNDLLIISGFQLFTFFNTYDSLLEFYLQKINDSNHITINQKMFKYQNLVKILNENKTYYLDFTVDHLIKLDNKYLDAEVTFINSNGTEYVLNKTNKVIRDLKGDNITVISNKKALIYFYKKIHDFSTLVELNFDKSQTGKILKFNITNINNDSETVNINIIKDFGFSGYYPMISEKSWNKVSGNQNIFTVYIENFYDKLENEDLYESEGEKFIIYIYSINKEKFKISNITYVDNLLSIKNKYNFQLIPANSKGVIILNVINYIYNSFYQFTMCKNKEIKFKIESSNGNFTQAYPTIEYPYKVTINESKLIQLYKYTTNEIVIHSFESDNEFLFLYSLNQFFYDYSYIDYEILSIFEIKNNILQIKFESISNAVGKYYLLIAKKDALNNKDSFSDICYISKLFINNDFNSIYVKNINTTPIINSSYLKSEDIDISQLNIKNKDELIYNIIGLYSDFSDKLLKVYEPKESIQKVIEINLEEKVKFKLNDKNIFKFKYNHYGDKKRLIYIYLNNAIYIDIYLTELNGESKGIDYSPYFYNSEIYLTNSGIYYLEFYPYYYQEYKNEGSLFVFLCGLIDIIDLSKNCYSNKKSIRIDDISVPDFVNKYYIVTNLTESKKIIFTYESDENPYYIDNPFIVCNNITNVCNDNVKSYYFEEGNTYTIFINFIGVSPRNGNYYYCYPKFKFYDESYSDSNSLVYIICGCAFGFIIILIALFLIIRYYKKKNLSTDFIKETKTLNNENLLSNA